MSYDDDTFYSLIHYATVTDTNNNYYNNFKVLLKDKNINIDTQAGNDILSTYTIKNTNKSNNVNIDVMLLDEIMFAAVGLHQLTLLKFVVFTNKIRITTKR